MTCPLGLEFCDQKRVSQDAEFFDVTCPNYYYCCSWVKPWCLPLHRITEKNAPLDFAAIGHDYYLVKFLKDYGYDVEGMQERDWRVYFAEYGYAEAVSLPNSQNYLVSWKLRYFSVTLPNGVIISMPTFDAIMNIPRSRN
jgi:hypothetical protein